LTEQVDQSGIVLADLPARQTQRKVALAVTFAFLGSAALIASFASVQLPRVDAVIPASQTLIFTNDLVTSVLLISQFTIVRWHALLVLACGYLFTALLDVAHLLTFPGAFAPTGLLGAGLNSTGWLYVFWHSGLPVAVISYVVLKDRAPQVRSFHGSTPTAVAISIAVVIAIVFGLIWMATAGERYLPTLFVDRTTLTSSAKYVGMMMFLLSAIALVMLWFRQRSVLDLWLMVVMCVWIMDILFTSVLGHSRFSVGFYASRVFSVITATLVLIVLLSETMTLYARLAIANFAQRRERDSRMMTMEAVAASIAHEIKQPLGGIVTSGNAGLNWLDRPIPEVQKARDSLQRIVRDGRRAAQVLDSIRSLFRVTNQEKRPIAINALALEVLELAAAELRLAGVLVVTDLSKDDPTVFANKVQLQQVILNLITNAIEAMRPITDRARALKVSSTNFGGHVLIAVEDSGSGIDPKNIEEIFDAFFTTKTYGTGMGLSICRSIIEAHDGKLWVTPKETEGVIFQFTVLTSDEPAGRRVCSPE
jgi:signal transduction histidine kinase